MTKGPSKSETTLRPEGVKKFPEAPKPFASKQPESQPPESPAAPARTTHRVVKLETEVYDRLWELRDAIVSMGVDSLPEKLAKRFQANFFGVQTPRHKRVNLSVVVDLGVELLSEVVRQKRR
jgi:hypothetical protein